MISCLSWNQTFLLALPPSCKFLGNRPRPIKHKTRSRKQETTPNLAPPNRTPSPHHPIGTQPNPSSRPLPHLCMTPQICAEEGDHLLQSPLEHVHIHLQRLSPGERSMQRRAMPPRSILRGIPRTLDPVLAPPTHLLAVVPAGASVKIVEINLHVHRDASSLKERRGGWRLGLHHAIH